MPGMGAPVGIGCEVVVARTKDELLAAAIEAQQQYERGVEKLRENRARAFRAAFVGPVTGREIAEATGLSESYVGRIAKGER